MHTDQTKVEEIINVFSNKYPDPETALNYNTSFELLIAVILSAQTTDKQVNKTTAKLFKEYNTPEDFARLNPEDLQEKIKSIGLYRNKSKYIIQTANKILNDFQGEIPSDRESLMELSGVGRKTANVVLSCAFSKDAFPVDTHVFRVSKRLGLSSGKNVRQTEKELQKVVPQNIWGKMHHWFILHGRETCKARNPLCDECPLKNLCHYINKK